MTRPHDLTVTVVSGGLSDEAYLSHRSAEVIIAALQSAGYKTELLEWSPDRVSLTPGTGPVEEWPDMVRFLATRRPAILFNATHGELENAGQLQGFAELAGVPLTGNGLAPSVIGMDKGLSHNEFERLGIRHPRSIPAGDPDQATKSSCGELLQLSGLEFPLMAKLTHGGSSSGLEYTENLESLLRTLQSWAGRGPVFLEEFVDGREFCVTVFGHWNSGGLQVFPPVEIDFPGAVFDKEAKFNNRYTVRLPEDLTETQAGEMRNWAQLLHEELRFVGFSRVDYRLHDGLAYALEVNTHPGLSPASIVTNSLQYANLDMEDVVDQLVRWALAETAG